MDTVRGRTSAGYWTLVSGRAGTGHHLASQWGPRVPRWPSPRRRTLYGPELALDNDDDERPERQGGDNHGPASGSRGCLRLQHEAAPRFTTQPVSQPASSPTTAAIAVVSWFMTFAVEAEPCGQCYACPADDVEMSFGRSGGFWCSAITWCQRSRRSAESASSRSSAVKQRQRALAEGRHVREQGVHHSRTSSRQRSGAGIAPTWRLPTAIGADRAGMRTVFDRPSANT
jgi:hypothetical protein